VLAAGASKTPASTRALSILCETYWDPIYPYIRRRGYGVEDAEDLTQGLFTHLLEKKGFDGVSRDRGKFRTFLLASMKNFAANEWRKGQARKRGGGARGLPVDFTNAERRLSTEPDGSRQTPESLFEKHWALALLSMVLDELRRDYEKAGYEAIFDSLKACLAVSEMRRPHRELAENSPLLEILVELSERPPVSTEEIYGYKKLKYLGYTKLLDKIPNLLASRNSANYLLIDGYLAHESGDSELALARCAQVMELGNLIRDYPFLVAQMVATSVSFLGLEFAERLGSEADLSDEALQPFIALLNRSYRRDAYLHSLDGERLAGIEQFEAIGHKVDHATFTSSDRGVTFLMLLYGTQPFRFFRNRDEVKYLKIAQANIDLAARPYYESADVLASIPGNQLKWPLRSYPITSLLVPHGPRLRQSKAEHETGVTLAVVGYQLKRHKKEHGAYPESLAALTPEFMAEVPLDEFDGKPLRYRREGEGFILYSVGTNLVDDGGEDSRGAGDYVWRFDS
jgi:RNA polymerase sigma-70 factor (ECF subfamily)